MINYADSFLPSCQKNGASTRRARVVAGRSKTAMRWHTRPTANTIKALVEDKAQQLILALPRDRLSNKAI